MERNTIVLKAPVGIPQGYFQTLRLILRQGIVGVAYRQLRPKLIVPVSTSAAACSCEIKDFYVAIVQCRPVRRNSTFRRHGLTSVCFFVFAYSVGVRLKLQKIGDGGSVLDYCGLATLNGLARNRRSLAPVGISHRCARYPTHPKGISNP